MDVDINTLPKVIHFALLYTTIAIKKGKKNQKLNLALALSLENRIETNTVLDQENAA